MYSRAFWTVFMEKQEVGQGKSQYYYMGRHTTMNRGFRQFSGIPEGENTLNISFGGEMFILRLNESNV